MILMNEDFSSTVLSTSVLMADKANFFKNIDDKRDVVKSLASIKFNIYLHANHEDCTRGLTIVSSLKHKIYRKLCTWHTYLQGLHHWLC